MNKAEMKSKLRIFDKYDKYVSEADKVPRCMSVKLKSLHAIEFPG